MKSFHLSLFVLVFVVVSCSTFSGNSGSGVSEPGNEPDWYSSRSVKKKPGFLVGYGQGHSPETAKAKAYNEITEQIRVSVKSETNISDRLKNGKSGKGLFSGY